MSDDLTAVVSAVRGEDEQAFGALVEPHRRELRVHCYRFLASYDDAEDAVQETYLRAWRHRRTYEGRASLRAWLYKIATNTCLEQLRRRPRPPVDDTGPTGTSCATIPWLQPFPDALLVQAAPEADQPESVVAQRDSVALAFLVAVQLLPPRQRAVLLLRDVLAFSAAETADLLDLTVPAANSALQRARATMARHREAGGAAPAPAAAADRAVADRFVRAHESADPELIVAVLRADARLTINPMGLAWEGRDAIVPSFRENMNALGTWRCIAVRANGQPAVAAYLRRPEEDRHHPFTLTVLDAVDGELVEMATFLTPELFGAFDLPASLP